MRSSVALFAASLSLSLANPQVTYPGDEIACNSWCNTVFTGSLVDSCVEQALAGTGPCFECGPPFYQTYDPLDPYRPPRLDPCGADGCVDTRIHPDHCGACGNKVPDGYACCYEATPTEIMFNDRHCGRCRLSVKPGQTCCSGERVDLAWDRNNCGSCGNKCSASQECRSGVCKVYIPMCGRVPC